MANEPRAPADLMLWPGLIGLVVVTLGVITRFAPLHSTRPPAQSFQGAPSGDSRGVAARLWQDPLQAVYDVPSSGIAQCLHDGDPESTTAVAGATLVLPVLVPGDPYSESKERRLRTRFAVLSALQTVKFVPRDSEHIGCLRLGEKGAVGARVPFEWFDQANRELVVPDTMIGRQDESACDALGRSPFDHVLVLWIDESIHRPDANDTLAGFLNKMLVAVRLEHSPVYCVGPTNSDYLAALFVRSDHECFPEPSRLYSPMSTIAPELLEALAPRPWDNGMELLRTIAPDDTVCKTLLDELDLRRIDVTDEAQHIALVGEWDTSYGQALSATFARAAEKHHAAQRGSTFGPLPRTIHLFNYLRGLDGITSDAGAGTKRSTDSSAADDKDKSKGSAADQPAAVGGSQLDYVRRIETELRALDAGLDRARGARLVAVGVFGSDVYDKLLILRALKPAFPRLVFFTTDLDARLLSPAEYEWTRNLIIASSFGLSLCRARQGSIPPFRDSYQTAVFYATQQALLNATVADTIEPRVFEVGRDGAYDLGVGSAAPPHPRSPRAEPWLTLTRLVLILMVAALLFLLVIPLSQPLHEFVIRYLGWQHLREACAPSGHDACPPPPADKRVRPILTRRRLFQLILGCMGGLIALVAIIWKDHLRASGEPFAVWQGISVWPTQMLRYVVAWLSVGYILSAWHQLDGSAEDIENRILGRCVDHTARDRTVDSTAHFLRRFYQHFICPWRPEGDAAAIWLMYARRQFPRARFWRVVFATTVYVLAAGLVFGLTEYPRSPTRGSVSFAVNAVLLVASVGGMTGLLFLVLDINRACNWLVAHLFDDPPRSWPCEVREKSKPWGALEPCWVDALISVRVIAAHSAVIDRFVYYPSIAFLLMMLARHPGFDAWDWPVGLIIIFGLALAGTLYAGSVLRFSAKRARRKILEELDSRVLHSRLAGDGKDKALAELRTAINDESRGAFSPLRSNPLIGALLVPSGGLGTIALLEHFLR